MFINWPLWEGVAYRSINGFHHNRQSTAGDVIRYEQDELNNHLGVSPDEVTYLDRFSANNIIWVGRTKNSVSRYGHPEIVSLGKNARIVANDGEDGYLVLFEC